MSNKVRNFSFTSWDLDMFNQNITCSNKINYMILGRELCPSTGKMHLQGFINTNNPLKNGKKVLMDMGFSNSIHVEISNGSPYDNFMYCSKDGDYLEWGPRPSGQGSRNDIDVVKNIIKEKGTMIDIIDKSSNYQSLRMGELLFRYLERKREVSKIEVIWLFGPAGTGKTRWVYDSYSNPYRPITEKWWEGYDGQKVILIDDFRTTWCSFQRLLQLTDIYPFKVECKGGSREVQYDTIIITAPCDHKTMWEYETKEALDQLSRRITLEREFGTEVQGNTKPGLLDNKVDLLTISF